MRILVTNDDGIQSPGIAVLAQALSAIGEVTEITNLESYVLRFWESEFSFLKPKKSRGNQRLYVQRDIETVMEIKRMLYEEGHTLEGVKRYWARRGRAASRPLPPKEMAKKLRGDLQAIVKIIESHAR